jgi:hypothetical protein
MKLDELIVEIRTIMNWLVENKISELDDGDYISNLIVKLASYNASLGQYVADLDRDSNQAEAHYELNRELAYKSARETLVVTTRGEKETTVADADNAKRIASESERQEYIQARHRYRVAAILREDVSNLIDALRSKLSYMKQEKNNS